MVAPIRRALALSSMWCLLVMVVSALPGAALAQQPDTARARSLFERGVAHAAEESWSEALAAFRASRAIVERPSTVYNIATTLQRLGRYREAIAAIDDYLRISDPSGDADQRAAATDLRATLERSLAHLSLTIEPPGARVTVDARDVAGEGGSRDLLLDPGDHVVVIAARGHSEERLEISLAPGERVERSVALSSDAAAAALAAPPAEPEPTPTPPARSIAEEPALWIVLGAVLVAGAAITAGVAVGTQSSPGVYEGTGGFTVEALRF